MTQTVLYLNIFSDVCIILALAKESRAKQLTEERGQNFMESIPESITYEVRMSKRLMRAWVGVAEIPRLQQKVKQQQQLTTIRSCKKVTTVDLSVMKRNRKLLSHNRQSFFRPFCIKNCQLNFMPAVKLFFFPNLPARD